MESVSASLTIYYDGQFYVGLVECTADGRMSAGRIVFGADPRDSEVADYIAGSWYRVPLSPQVAVGAGKPKAVNPKRRQREIARQINTTGPGTKSQQALQLLREQTKTERVEKSREQRDAEKQAAFELRQQKKKEKHRGH